MSVVTLLVAIVPTVFYSMGLTFVFRDAVCAVLTPMQKIFNYASESIDGFASYFYKFDELVEENNALREQVSELQSQIYDAAEIEEMYAWMSEYLDLKMRHSDFKFLAASVTGRESSSFSKVLTLDTGSGSGVELGMPVITSEGIVGQVTELGYNWCKVTTIVEANSSVGAYVERTNESGVCVGSFEMASDGLCELKYLPADSDVQAGDRVISTGFGSVYPRGMTVGYVESVEVNPYSRSLDITVACAVDFSGLNKVMIITDFEETSVDAAELAG